MSIPKFWIERLNIYGSGNKSTSIDFEKGLNLIIGPSNTGKSLIVDCIDYAFGYVPKGPNNHYRLNTIKDNDYELIELILRTDRGSIAISREIGANEVNISGSDSRFEHGLYSCDSRAKKSLNLLLLQLIGINEPDIILSSVKGKTNKVTWRGFQHLFLVRQANIAAENSIFINPENRTNSMTSSPALLLYLLNGINANDIPSEEDIRINTERKKAVIEYMEHRMDKLSARHDYLCLVPDIINVKDPKIIDSLESKIHIVENELNSAISECKEIISRIYELNGKLSKFGTIKNTFSVLRSQYNSDIDRMAFIADGELSSGDSMEVHDCPFCGNKLLSETGDSYIDRIKSSLTHIKSHISDLNTADTDVSAQEESVRHEIRDLENQKKVIDARIENELRPKLDDFNKLLRDYETATTVAYELNLIETEQAALRTELFEKKNEEDLQEKEYHISEYYDKDTVSALADKFINVLENVHFPGYDSTHFNLDTFDLQFGSKSKSSNMGGGFCSIINAIMIVGLKEHLLESGTYAPGIAIVDSPLSQLSESEYKKSSNQINKGFLDYLIKNQNRGQTIIVEQKEKMPESIKELCKQEISSSDINIIEFTGDKDHGVYGLLPEVYNE